MNIQIVVCFCLAAYYCDLFGFIFVFLLQSCECLKCACLCVYAHNFVTECVQICDALACKHAFAYIDLIIHLINYL